jgi:predicted RNase H-like HicB family nuclease
MRKIKVILEREDEGGYSVYVPLLPGCASQGETREEALANIKEAIECYLEGLRMDGLPMPESKEVEEEEVEVAV